MPYIGLMTTPKKHFITLNEPVLRQMLAFIASPAAYYAERSQKPTGVCQILGLEHMDATHPSVLNPQQNAQSMPARDELKAILDAIAEQSTQLLEKTKDGAAIGQSEFNRRLDALGKQLRAAEQLKKHYTPDSKRDNPEHGMFVKFFEGRNTLEACVLGAAGSVSTFLKAQSASRNHAP